MFVLGTCAHALTPPLLTDFERISFQLDREREGFVRRLRQQVAGGDPLSVLQPASYALAPGSAVAITGANDGIGKAAATFLAREGYAPILCCRTQSNASSAVVTAARSRGQIGIAMPKLAKVSRSPMQATIVEPSRRASTSLSRGLSWRGCRLRSTQRCKPMPRSVSAESRSHRSRAEASH